MRTDRNTNEYDCSLGSSPLTLKKEVGSNIKLSFIFFPNPSARGKKQELVLMNCFLCRSFSV